jgi:hypothetical protein
MSASQNISRGFHRLGIFLALIPFIVGAGWSLKVANEDASNLAALHDDEVSYACAKKVLMTDSAARREIESKYTDAPPGFLPEDERVDLQKLGCASSSEIATVGDLLNVPEPMDFSYAGVFYPTLAPGLVVSLILSLLVYCLVRAIVWVIGGFVSGKWAGVRSY